MEPEKTLPEVRRIENEGKINLDLDIINAVRQCPQLYQNQTTIAERHTVWRQLSERLNISDQFLKSRWHLLRSRFVLQNSGGKPQNGSSFKYFAEMAFLRPHLRVAISKDISNEEANLPANVIKPEFIITEKDLAAMTNDDDGEEHVFLEVEALECSNDEEEESLRNEEVDVEIETDKTEQQENRKLLEQLTGDPSEKENAEEKKQIEEIKLEKDDEIKNNEKEKEELQEKKDKLNDKRVDEEQKLPEKDNPNEKQNRLKICSPRTLNRLEKKVITPEKQKLEKTAVEIGEVLATETEPTPKLVAALRTEQVDAVKEHNSPPRQECKLDTIERDSNKHGSSNGRSEDDIFGELVSAMLKPMPAEKKRAIKKDIMNLLLT